MKTAFQNMMRSVAQLLGRSNTQHWQPAAITSQIEMSSLSLPHRNLAMYHNTGPIPRRRAKRRRGGKYVTRYQGTRYKGVRS